MITRLPAHAAHAARSIRLDVLAAYGLMACLFVWRGHPLRTQLLGPPSDPVMSTWFLLWWPYAIRHGLNPFVTHMMWHHSGLNVTWSTSLFFPALLMAPCTAAFGALASYNILSITAPALGAWSCFFLLRNITGRALPALLGGCMFGFSSYESAQVRGHLNLSLIAVLPLVVLLCKKHYDGTLGRRRFVLWLALAAIAEVGISTEIMLTMAMFGATAWAVCLALFDAQGRTRLIALARDTALAAGVSAIVLAPFLVYLALGLRSIPDVFNSATLFSMDPLAPVVPTLANYVGGAFFLPISNHFTGYFGEQGGYIGLPFAIIAVLMLQVRRPRGTVALNVMLGIILVASLGPRLHVGESVSARPLPWAVIARLPLCASILPSRFSLYLALCVAISVALWLSTPRPRWSRYALAILGLILILPDPALLVWSDWPRDPFFTRQNILRTLGPDANALILPFAETGPGMAWQMDADMSFTQAAGYGAYTPREENAWAAVAALRQRVVPPDFADIMSGYCGTHGIGTVLVGPGTAPVLRDAIFRLGWPVRPNGDVSVVTVPPDRLLRYRIITGEYWPDMRGPGWMGREIRVMSRGEASRVTLRPTVFRPAGAGPAGFTVTGPNGSTHHVFSGQPVIAVDVPADTEIAIRADSTFVPDRLIRNGDTRRLSLAVQLTDPAAL